MCSATTHRVDQFRALVGCRFRATGRLEVTEERIRSYATAIHNRHPVHWSATAAARFGYPGLVAPPTFVSTALVGAHREILSTLLPGCSAEAVLHTDQTLRIGRHAASSPEPRPPSVSPMPASVPPCEDETHDAAYRDHMRRVFGILVLSASASLAAAGPGWSEVPGSHVVGGPDPRVGAVMFGDSPLHTCSGAVLHSREGDLVITAAHCVIGTGSLIGFSPGYERGEDPKGRWRVTEVYLDPRWIESHDVDRDYAILRVRPVAGAPNTSIESAVGGGLRLAANPRPGDIVTVTGYGVGLLDAPTSCTRPAGTENGYASFTCEGFVYGTSGGPWVAANGADLVGIIAGPHLGGCADGVSYTPPFDESLGAIVRRAEEHGPADAAPVTNPFDDDC
ncbi:FAS1-like dehydratase domain-containing protein [Nocardia arizonensis]|uniref:FAS1-like dehydratase domain-containing protein n=1 Tax=Nocardia arizonensis TaxID=1141647 RepID=UPI0006D17B79|nr:MaoC family dehydratase N-terminal domain-containing protein [Nocardia arizonensis]